MAMFLTYHVRQQFITEKLLITTKVKNYSFKFKLYIKIISLIIAKLLEINIPSIYLKLINFDLSIGLQPKNYL